MLAIQRFTAIGALDAAFWLYRRHFGLLFGISLIVGVPVTCSGAAQSYWKEAADPALSLVLSLPNAAVSVLANTIGTAATTFAVSRIARGQTVSIKSALGQARRVFPRLLAATLLIVGGVAICAFLAAALVAGVSVGLLSTRGSRHLIMLGLVALALGAPALALLVRWSLIAPVIVLEGARPARALGRSVELSEGRRWKILTVLALYLLATVSIAGGLAVLLGLLEAETAVGQLLQTLLAQATSALLSPVLYSAVVLLYYDARVELEAFDVATLATWHTDQAA
jgi:hypothetical protein